MTTIDIKLQLPDEVAQEAAAQGLLTAATVEQLIRAELKRRKTEQLFAIMDRLADADKGTLTEQDIDAEINAYRAERRGGRADSH